MKYISQQQVWRLCLKYWYRCKIGKYFSIPFLIFPIETEIISEGEAIPRLYGHLQSLEKIMEAVVWSAQC